MNLKQVGHVRNVLLLMDDPPTPRPPPAIVTNGKPACHQDN